ncbi:MAG: type II secretion system protein GspD [Planctomycetota bacterium]|jgi:hypothetical protein
MRKSSRKISLSRRIVYVLTVVTLFMWGGCGDFSKKTTEEHSRRIIRDLKQIEEVPDLDRPLPSVYLAEPKIIESKDGVKLYYFSRHHTVDKFAGSKEKPGLIQEQFGFPVSQNPATNQLIVNCPTRQEAEMVLAFLKEVDVQPIQIKIDCLISEIYADKTMDWETTLEIQDLFGEDIFLGSAARILGKDIAELVADGAILPAFPGASMRAVGRARMGLKIGYVSDDFLAVVDILESRGYLKVLMHPTVEVVNGRKATISATELVPLPKEVITKQLLPYITTVYQDVVDSLEITPHAFADGSIGLETKVQISSKNVPEGVKQIPILTKREVNIEENRIRPGDSLVIGGIKKSEEFSVVRGVPLLKDIPIIGMLFSSKDFEERATETIFIITPSISGGGIPHKEMIEEVRRKHESPSPEGLEEAILDPFGFKAREKEHERKILQAEESRIEAETEKARARGAVKEAREQTELAITDAQRARQEAVSAKQLAEEEKKKAEEAATQTKKATAETEKAKAEVEKLKAEAEKAKDDAKKAKAEAEKAKDDAKKAKDEAEKAKAEETKDDAEAAKKTEEETEKKEQETDKAKAEADKKAGGEA